MLANGSLGPQTDTGPGLQRRVAILAEQHALPFGTPRQQQQQGVGLGEAGEIMEVAVLAKGELAVTRASNQRGTRQQHGGIARQCRHQRLAALTILGVGNGCRARQGLGQRLVQRLRQHGSSLAAIALSVTRGGFGILDLRLARVLLGVEQHGGHADMLHQGKEIILVFGTLLEVGRHGGDPLQVLQRLA